MMEWSSWNQIPDVISKEQFCRICHVSKATARYLLQSGTVPCRNTGKKIRCYQIRKEDLREYLEQRGICPEHYAACAGWYGTRKSRSVGLPKNLSEDTLQKLHSYYTALLVNCPDVLSTSEVVELTGYCRTTVTHWCSRNRVTHFTRRGTNYIPKVFLVDFFCSEEFRTVSRKTLWHVRTLRDFQQRLKAQTRRGTKNA